MAHRALINIQNLTVDICGVRQVVQQVLEGALASDNGLDKEAEHGEHGQAPILDLLDLDGRKEGGQSSAWHLVSHCACKGHTTQTCGMCDGQK